MLLTLESEWDKRENHRRLQVGPQFRGHLFHDEIVNSRHLEQAVAGISLPMDIPLGEAAVGDRSQYRLDNGDHSILTRSPHAHLHGAALARLYLQVGTIQLDELASSHQVVLNLDDLPTIEIVHHVEPVGARHQRENVSWLNRKQVGNCPSLTVK